MGKAKVSHCLQEEEEEEEKASWDVHEVDAQTFQRSFTAMGGGETGAQTTTTTTSLLSLKHRHGPSQGNTPLQSRDEVRRHDDEA